MKSCYNTTCMLPKASIKSFLHNILFFVIRIISMAHNGKWELDSESKIQIFYQYFFYGKYFKSIQKNHQSLILEHLFKDLKYCLKFPCKISRSVFNLAILLLYNFGNPLHMNTRMIQVI
jgi:hypothetical protein